MDKSVEIENIVNQKNHGYRQKEAHAERKKRTIEITNVPEHPHKFIYTPI